MGRNCEMMTNVVFNSDGTLKENGSRVSYVGEGDGCCELRTLPGDQARCGLMMNLLVSEGKPGKVRFEPTVDFV